MADVPLPRPGPLGLIQYAGVDMREYAAAVSAAKDADIAGLRAELLKSLAHPDVVTRLEKMGTQITPMAAEEMDGFIARENSRWAGVIRQRNIKPLG